MMAFQNNPFFCGLCNSFADDDDGRTERNMVRMLIVVYGNKLGICQLIAKVHGGCIAFAEQDDS